MDKETIEIIALLEQAVMKVNELRRKASGVPDDQPPVVDQRSLSIAVTHIETAQLWVANSRR